MKSEGEIEISEKDIEQALDDLTACGILEKVDADGNKQKVKLTPARKERVETAEHLALVGAMMFEMYKDGTLQKILDEVKRK